MVRRRTSRSRYSAGILWKSSALTRSVTLASVVAPAMLRLLIGVGVPPRRFPKATQREKDEPRPRGWFSRDRAPTCRGGSTCPYAFGSPVPKGLGASLEQAYSSEEGSERRNQMKQLEAHAQPAIVTDPPIAQFLFG